MIFRVFEVWRLSAALLVMVYHFLRYAPPGIEEVSHRLYSLLPLMDMFLMISGFLIMMRYEPMAMRGRGFYAQFLLRRLARFYPLYLVTLAFFVLVGVAVHLGIVQSGDAARYAWSALPQNIFLLQGWGTTDNLTFNYVAWTLSAEWFCYILFPVFVVTFRVAGISGLGVLAVLTMIAMEIAIAAGVMPGTSWFHADTHAAPRAFADFALGAMIAMAVRDLPISLSSPVLGWLAFAVAVIAMLAGQNNYLILALLALSMFLSAAAETNNPRGSAWLAPLHPVGRVSFGIYLLHPVIETILLAAVWRWFLAPLGVGFLPMLAVTVVVTVLVAMASDRTFEKYAAERFHAFAGALTRRLSWGADKVTMELDRR